MSVRRLAPKEVQPESFVFTDENLAWAEKTIAKYPAGRQASAVIPLLMRAQEQAGGWVSEPAMRYVGEMLGMAPIRVYEVATFYTQFQLQPVGKKAHVQVCGTTPCMLRGAEDLMKVCKKRINAEPFHLSADGDFSWEEVECAGTCTNAPMIQVFKDVYEDLTPEDLEKILDAFERGEKPTPGPQNGRRTSEPVTGLRVLTSPELYDGSMVGTGAGLALAREAIAAKANGDTPPAAPPPAAAAAAPPAPPKSDPAPAVAPAAKAVEAAAVADAEKVPDTFRPKGLTAANDGKADDLTLIWGVGEKLAAVLHGLGVYHFSQIAAWNEDNLKWVDQNLEGFPGRASRDKWIEQAAKLATGWRPSGPDGDKPN
ncbi:NADH-quinone oxidoreductase subunit NuoE [Ancylobacter pratisalsi]|uniref:NADH-quinone oxidoreductase subunit NuoE n=1 Tax=Ancylobacter pratisalsi TaxID=1745854 RepID=A0A6P1YUA1_9HYPH|nr:NADH-quinone oxidoreductase subunit NuoE [Ancylobacter pratisalsi]QIB35653.1 NADH-quinone oxidoreductase subunit NuoE [Ancylobacter pratisalsi]